MAKDKVVDRAKRKAAGHTCMMMFGVCNTLAHSIRQIASEDPPSGEGMGRGLTPGEREFVRKLATDFHEKGEVLRKLGWRFRGVST